MNKPTFFKQTTVAVVLSVLTLSALPVLAETPEEQGRAIAVEMDKRDMGWKDSMTKMTMVLSNSQGDKSTRELRLKSLEVIAPGLGDKSITIFDRPRDVEGTAFLSHTKIKEADDQWLYLPALKRVKRISSANKSGPFMGSEFAYEDLLSQEVEKYTYKRRQDEPCGSLDCFVFERYPLYENSGYTRQVVWADKKEYRPIKIEFYDRKSARLKTLKFSNYHLYLNKFWRALNQSMVNHQTGKRTDLTFDPYKFQVGLNDGDFTANRLKRTR